MTLFDYMILFLGTFAAFLVLLVAGLWIWDLIAHRKELDGRKEKGWAQDKEEQ